MHPSVWEKIAVTPWWIIAIFIYLLVTGFKARTKSHTISLRHLKLIILMLLFSSCLSLYSISAFNFSNLLYVIPGFLIGITGGWSQLHLSKTKAVPEKNQIIVHGTWNLLIVTLLSMVFYFMQRNNNFDVTTFMLDPNHQHFFNALYGFFIGFTVGRWQYASRLLKRDVTLV
jgi:ABC-type multidrug transport system permease subunit